FNILLRAMNSSVQERFSPLVLVRLLLPSLFPQYDKLITCDVDIVFANDMSESYFALNTDDSHYLAVVKDLKSGSSVTDMIKIYLETAASQKMNIHKHFFSPEQWQILHKNSLNIGFAVFNLKAWRKDRIEEQCIEFFAHKGHGLCFPEQDTLTLLCYKHILELPYIYNTHPFYLDIPHHPVHQIIQNVEEVIVWHFYGQEKPWDPQNLYKAQLWIRALLRTPFTDTYFENYYRWLADDKELKAYLPYLEPLLTKKVLCGYIFYKIQKLIRRWYTDLYNWWEFRKV
ncbi:glycosyltransferase family 8 protein, partial [Helicobacter salomonis]|uniref:glycosyltransferase family 8 protein n=1 Tax=Helicobacter salomonis TaxID=56878 RepID=UPI001F3E2A16